MTSVRVLSGPDPEELAHLRGIVDDLGFVVDASTRLCSLLDGGDADVVLHRALYSSAVVAYLRCFGSGHRTRLTEEEFIGIGGAPRAMHEFLKNVRDKHVAHSVSPFEDAVVLLQVGANGVGEGIAEFLLSQVSADREGVEGLASLADQIRTRVAARASVVRERVAAAAQLLSLEEVEALPRFEPKEPTASDAGTTRATRRR